MAQKWMQMHSRLSGSFEFATVTLKRNCNIELRPSAALGTLPPFSCLFSHGADDGSCPQAIVVPCRDLQEGRGIFCVFISVHFAQV